MGRITTFLESSSLLEFLQHHVEYHKLKYLSRLMQTVSFRYLLRIRELERLRRSPLLLRRDVFLKRRLSAWFKKLNNLLRRIRESRRESMLVTALSLTYTPSRTNWRMTRRVLQIS